MSSSGRSSHPLSWPTLIWLLWCLLIVALSMLPMHPPSATTFTEALRAALTPQIQEPVAITLLQRLMAFLPLGLLWFIRLRRRGVGQAALRALMGVLLMALGIELAQAAISDRHAYASDVLIAVVVGGLGILLGHRWVREGDRRPPRCRQEVIVAIGILALNLVATWPVVDAYHGATLENWDCSYPWRIGAEPTGNRLWEGEVVFAALYDRPLSAEEIGASTPPPGAVVEYRPDPQRVSGRSAVIDPWPGEGEQACRRLKASGAFTVLLRARSLRAEQTGPARLLTQSLDKTNRNLTLGDDGGHLVFRVRTPSNGPSGSLHEVVSNEEVLRPGVTLRLAGVFARGGAQLWVEGAPVGTPFRFYAYWIVDKLTILSTTQLSFFFALGLGVLAAALHRLGRLPGWPLTGPLLASGAPLAALGAAFSYHLPVHHALFAATLAGALLGMGLGRRLLNDSDQESGALRL